VHAGCADDLAPERDRDLLLDLLGREAGNLRDHLESDIGDVGIGFDRQLRPAVPAVERDENER
jgi:hypothetical protein